MSNPEQTDELEQILENYGRFILTEVVMSIEKLGASDDLTASVNAVVGIPHKLSGEVMTITQTTQALTAWATRQQIKIMEELMYFGVETGAFKIGSRGIRKHEIKTVIRDLKNSLGDSE